MNKIINLIANFIENDVPILKKKWQLWPKIVIIRILQSLYNFISTLGGFSTEVGLLKSIFTLEQGALESDNKGNWKNSTHALLSTRSDFTVIPNNDDILTCYDQ